MFTKNSNTCSNFSCYLSVAGCLIVLFEQLFEHLPQGKTAGEKTMSTLTINSFGSSTSGKSIVNQGFLSNQQTNPSGQQSLVRLNRRGRLARTCVVLSLTVVMAAGFASQSGAGQDVASTAPSYEIIVVTPGVTLWSVAAEYASGDVQAMVNDIREANNLSGFDLQTGQKLRVPLK
jgi:LysM repeat protein